VDHLLAAHRTLLQDGYDERQYADKFHDMQNWIGGSDYNPRGAVHVPPPPEMVAALIGDLLDYSNRADVLTTRRPSRTPNSKSIHPSLRQRPHRARPDQRSHPPPQARGELRGTDRLRCWPT